MNADLFPPDYPERAYAGVLGKLIGVYLGRPFEGWSHEQIMAELGEVWGYVHERFGAPLIVTDDDISGTFTFVRALADTGAGRQLTPAQIGQTWLNYLIEEQTILWWGGLGNSTEHTAYLRLKAGIPAPASGSIALNGQVVAEQIGAQIFIDSWAMLAPGDPALAADFARRAASVSHDGEAVYAAQVIAAMEAQAFVEANIDRLIDCGLSFIPPDSVIAHLIGDLRGWHAETPDWRTARARLDERYGYPIYGGNCHVVPNHGLIVLALLYGGGDFARSLMIVNTAGWDTDCNAGNLGCLLGIRGGLAGLAAGADWRGPLADRLYLPTADGGRAITDALTETYHLVNLGRALHDLPPLAPKGGARFHFSLSGAVQGFTGVGGLTLANAPLPGEGGARALALKVTTGEGGRACTPTFIPSRETALYFDRHGYRLLASPTLYPGQTIRARVVADPANAGPLTVALLLRHYDAEDALADLTGEPTTLAPGGTALLDWRAPQTGQPIAAVGLEISGTGGHGGTLYLDWLTWDGAPTVSFNRPPEREANRLARRAGPLMWKRAWIDALDSRDRQADLDIWPESYRLIQNEGRGLLSQGTREWRDYEVTARLTPHLCQAGGLAVRVQGLRRYYALLLDRERTRLVRVFEGQDQVLAERAGGWAFGQTVELRLRVEGNGLTAFVNGEAVLTAADPDGLYTGGGIALVCEVGRIACEQVAVGPMPTVTERVMTL